MSRRPFSFPIRSEGGPVLGSGTEMRVYDDAALTTLSTISSRASGGVTVPNPRTPNQGRQTQLLADRAGGDTFITVVDITGFAVGDLIPIYNGTSTVYRVIEVITGGTRRFDLDAALGVAFLAANTQVNNLDMKGHVYGFLDDAIDYYVQTKNLASTRVLPPVIVPIRVPAVALQGQDEGVDTGSPRSRLNAVGTAFTLTDSGTAIVLTHGTLATHTGLLPATSFDDTAHGVRTTANAHAFTGISGVITDAQHGVRALANAHDFAQISGTVPAHASRHNSGGADVMSIDAAAGTGSLRTIGAGSTQAAAGNHAHQTITAEQATTSGTSIDFTGIPAGVKRVTVMFDGVSTNGTSIPIVQIGDSGGIETTGYLSAGGNTNTSGLDSTTGFGINTTTLGAAAVISGSMVLTLQDSANNTWTMTFDGRISTNIPGASGGIKATSAVLDRVRLTTTNGTDTFDAGAVSISYE